MKIKTLTDLGAFQENTYIVYEGNEALVIDPGVSFEEIDAFLENENIDKVNIFLTHGHIDHIYYVQQLANKYNSTVYIHPEDEKMLYDSTLNSSKLFGMPIEIEGVNVQTVTDQVPFKNLTFPIFHVPGHTPGQAILLVKPLNALFSGDFLFLGSIGRCDLPGGNESAMYESLKLLPTFDPNLTVYPGHGDKTTIKDELKYNPFCRHIE